VALPVTARAPLGTPAPPAPAAAATIACASVRRGTLLDAPTAETLVRDLRAALAGRVVVCLTHDDLDEPADTVVRLRADEPVRAGG
jgi:hypothetical protein